VALAAVLVAAAAAAAVFSNPDDGYAVCLHTHKCIQPRTETKVLNLDCIAGNVNNKIKKPGEAKRWHIDDAKHALCTTTGTSRPASVTTTPKHACGNPQGGITKL
jgi:hypothetical protein